MVTRLDKAGIVSSGSTAERTLGDRFSETVNVRDFGATGDGVTDDSDAIRAAIEAAKTIWALDQHDPEDQTTPAILYFPTGTYNCNKTQFTIRAPYRQVEAPAQISIKGNGPENSIIKNGGFLFFGTNTNRTRVTDLGFYGPMKDDNVADTNIFFTNAAGSGEWPGDGVSWAPHAITWTPETVPVVALMNGSDTSDHVYTNIAMEGYRWAYLDASNGSATRMEFSGLHIYECQHGVYAKSSGFKLHDFWIWHGLGTVDGVGVHIDADDVGYRTENCQLTYGEITDFGTGILLTQFEQDYKNFGRYAGDYTGSPDNLPEGWTYEGGLYYHEGELYGTGSSGPTVPVVFNTRIDQVASTGNHVKSVEFGIKHAIKAVRKVAAGTQYFDGVAHEWAEIEFDEPFPVGKYGRPGGYGWTFDGGTTTFHPAALTCLKVTSLDPPRYVFAIKFDDVVPDGYTSGDVFGVDFGAPGDAYMGYTRDLVIGPGVSEGVIVNCRFNYSHVDSIRHWRFGHNRFRTSFHMKKTVNDNLDLSFFNNYGLWHTNYVDAETSWADWDDGDGGVIGLSGQTRGDVVLNGPGSSTGWASVQYLSSHHNPKIDGVNQPLNLPRFVIRQPKVGGDTDDGGRPLEFMAISVGDSSISMEGLPEATGEPASLTVGDLWIDTGDGNTIKIKTS